MIVRALDNNGDWTYGKGQNDYKSSNNAIAQIIQTRLSSFVGDCFFALQDGINWFNLLGGKNQLAINLAVSAVIINTPNVTGILQLSIVLNDITRVLTIAYKVQTTFSVLSNQFQYDIGGLAA